MQNSETIVKDIINNLTLLGLNEITIDNIMSIISLDIINKNKTLKLPLYVETGFQPIDYLLYPIINNSRIHIYGREATAKTSIICHILQSMITKYSCTVLWIDSTFRLNKDFFNKIDIENNVAFESTSEITNDIISLVSQKNYDVVVLDDIASFQQYSLPKLEKLLHTCKASRILMLIANQVRQSPTTGKVYAPKEQLYANYDIVLQSTKYRVNYEKKYKDYDLKLEYHKQNDAMYGKNIIIPIKTSGLIHTSLMTERLDKIIKEENFNSFEDLLKSRFISITGNKNAGTEVDKNTSGQIINDS